MTENLDEFWRAQLADCEMHWSAGTFGALAEFIRESHEPAVISESGRDLSVVTDRGGIRISPIPEMQLVASESVMRESWSHRVALCLHETDSVMSQRSVLSELGPDTGPLRNCDRGGILFDLGLGGLHVDACIRVSDPTVVSVALLLDEMCSKRAIQR
jgi:hypothetical protein